MELGKGDNSRPAGPSEVITPHPTKPHPKLMIDDPTNISGQLFSGICYNLLYLQQSTTYNALLYIHHFTFLTINQTRCLVNSLLVVTLRCMCYPPDVRGGEGEAGSRVGWRMTWEGQRCRSGSKLTMGAFVGMAPSRASRRSSAA